MLKIIPHLVHGFHGPSFTSAFFGAILLSLITGIFTGWEKKRPPQRMRVEPPPQESQQDVIDI